jgi:hypothetical protein
MQVLQKQKNQNFYKLNKALGWEIRWNEARMVWFLMRRVDYVFCLVKKDGINPF